MKKTRNKSFLIVIILFITALTFMTVGFAAYNAMVNIVGSTTLKPDGKIYIKSVEVKSLTATATVDPDPVFTDYGITEFNLSFETDNNLNTQYQAVFEITIANESSYDFLYNTPEYSFTVIKDGNVYSNLITATVSGITNGENITSNTEKAFDVTITFSNPDLVTTGTYIVNGEFIPNLKEDTVGRLIGEVDTSIVGDLRGSNEMAAFTVNVISTYSESKTFTITVADTNKYIVVDSNGLQNHQYTITANNPGEDFTFYVKKATGNFDFNTEIEKVKILVVPSGESGVNVGRVSVRVDTNGPTDTVAPNISNVTVEYNSSNYALLVSWQATDNMGESALDDYTIIPYKKGAGDTYEAQPSVTTVNKSYTFTNLRDGIYYFTVYGKDTDGNVATALEIQRAETTEGHACKSADFDAKWEFTVTYRLSGTTSAFNISNNSTDTAYRFTTYSATLSVSNGYECQITRVTMGGTTKTYSYTNNRITIQSPITGNIEISASASATGGTTPCLVEGTKILLASGMWKNIEDIEYTDLLAVYDHINGGINYVYPIWIEKMGTGSSYIKVTFDDGTILNAYGFHCLFDVDKQEYVDVSRGSQFNAGSRVYKIEDGKLKIVVATNIERIEEEVHYYDVVATTYYNVIANGLITTDIITQNMNILYMFDDKAVFKRYDEVCSWEQLKAEDFNLPKYLFKGFNFANTSYLEGRYVSINAIGDFLAPRTLAPITRDGSIYFIVTTSLDRVNRVNKNYFLYKEGSSYRLPEGKAKYYIETSTNKKYMPGDVVEVENSMHFMAINE